MLGGEYCQCGGKNKMGRFVDLISLQASEDKNSSFHSNCQKIPGIIYPGPASDKMIHLNQIKLLKYEKNYYHSYFSVNDGTLPVKLKAIEYRKQSFTWQLSSSREFWIILDIELNWL